MSSTFSSTLGHMVPEIISFSIYIRHEVVITSDYLFAYFCGPLFIFILTYARDLGPQLEVVSSPLDDAPYSRLRDRCISQLNWFYFVVGLDVSF